MSPISRLDMSEGENFAGCSPGNCLKRLACLIVDGGAHDDDDGDVDDQLGEND